MTKKTPDGAGKEYTDEATASANTNGKAAATPAAGDPVTSPIQGNPGENRPDMAYDYSLSATQPSNPIQSAQVLSQSAQAAAADPVEYAELVRARVKGHYGEIREVGDVFANDQNLPTYPEDPNSWFEDADKPAEEKTSKRRGR